MNIQIEKNSTAPITPNTGSFSNITPETSKKPKPPRGAKTLFRHIINTTQSSIFEKDILEGHFQRGSDFNEDITIVSKPNIPKNIQKQLFIEIIHKKIPEISKEELENTFNNLDNCKEYIRSKLFGKILYFVFNENKFKKINEIITFFGKKETTTKLLKFEKLYCGDKESLDTTLNCIFNMAYSFKNNEFENIFLSLLDLSMKFNGECIRRNYLQRGKKIIESIDRIWDEHKTEKILDRLIKLAERKRSNERVIEIFKELYEIAVWEDEKTLLKSINKRI